jgi:hypothetical protein
MFCSGCGHALAPGQAFCAQCGRPSAAVIPPIPGLQFQLQSYAGKIRVLAIFWFIYAGIALLTGFAGLAFAHAIMSGAFGQWMHGPLPPMALGHFMLQFVWFFVIAKVALAVCAGWGLMQRAQWGRMVAIIAAIFSMITPSGGFLFSLAMGIWTLVLLLGYRNGTLYEQL